MYVCMWAGNCLQAEASVIGVRGLVVDCGQAIVYIGVRGLLS